MLEKHIVRHIMHLLTELTHKYAGKMKFWINPTTGIFDQKKGVYRRHVDTYHIRGASDIIGLIDGKFVAIEVKTKIGRPTPEQLKFISEIQDCEGIAFVSRSAGQTFDQLLLCFPSLEPYKYVAEKWKKLEANISDEETRLRKNKTRVGPSTH